MTFRDKETVHMTPAIREAIFKRDNYTCQKCGLRCEGYCTSLLWVVSVQLSKWNTPGLFRGFQTQCVYCVHNKPSYV